MSDRESPTHFPLREADWIGRVAERRVRVTQELLDRFVDLSGDSSPIHVRDEVARQQGFERRVAHGMLLGALASAVIGVELPGPGGVVQQFKLAFRNPCYVEDEIVIRVEVTECFASVQTLALKITIQNTHGVILATGEVRSGLRQIA